MAYHNAILDIVLVPSGLALITAYHIWLLVQLKRRPLSTVIGAAHANRRIWVRSVMKDSASSGMLAVQSLRNSIMACVLFASTAASAAVVIATVLTSVRLDTIQKTLSFMMVGSTSPDILLFKVFLLFLCFLVSFLCHTQANRFLSHVNFLISIPIDPELAPGLSIEYVQHMLARGDNFYSVGVRAFYFLLPLTLWLFGPIPMFLTSVVTVAVLGASDFSSEFLMVVDYND